MSIDEAIQYLNELIVGTYYDALPEHTEALKIGITALNIIRALSFTNFHPNQLSLPDETKETEND